jgi:hypothetical protein
MQKPIAMAAADTGGSPRVVDQVSGGHAHMMLAPRGIGNHPSADSSAMNPKNVHPEASTVASGGADVARFPFKEGFACLRP